MVLLHCDGPRSAEEYRHQDPVGPRPGITTFQNHPFGFVNSYHTFEQYVGKAALCISEFFTRTASAFGRQLIHLITEVEDLGFLHGD